MVPFWFLTIIRQIGDPKGDHSFDNHPYTQLLSRPPSSRESKGLLRTAAAFRSDGPPNPAMPARPLHGSSIGSPKPVSVVY